MKRGLAFFAFCLLSFAGTAFAQDPAALVQVSIDAYNNRNIAYFEKALAPDVIWLDDDGHIIKGKAQVTRFFVTGPLTAASPRKLTISNVQTGAAGDTAWGAFAYVMEQAGVQKKGLGTIVYTKVGADWQIALVQAAINAVPQH